MLSEFLNQPLSAFQERVLSGAILGMEDVGQILDFSGLVDSQNQYLQHVAEGLQAIPRRILQELALQTLLSQKSSME